MPSTASLLHLLFLVTLFSIHITTILTVNSIFNPVVKPIISFCIGKLHACAVFDTFQMKCWGKGSSIGLSNDYGDSLSTVGDAIPYFNPGTDLTIKQVTCLYEGFCVLLNNGGLKCAGRNDKGQTGVGSTTTPIGESTGYFGDFLPYARLGFLVVASTLSSGPLHTCALTTTGKVKCFGFNDHGQLGYGNTIDKGSSTNDMGVLLPYLDFGVNVTVASLHSSSNSHHNCVILSAPANAAQRIKCWGYNLYFQLGYGLDSNNRGDESGEMGDSLPLVDFGIESRVKQLALGGFHTCALLVNDVLKCYGDGESGEIGTGSSSRLSNTGDSLPSVVIDSGKTIKLIAGG